MHCHSRATVRCVRPGPLVWTTVTWTRRSRCARSFGRWCGPNSLRKTQCKCRHFLVLCAKPGLVPSRVVVFVTLRAITQRRSWKMLCNSVWGSIRVCTTAGQSVTRLGPQVTARTTVRSWSARVYRKFVVPVALHTFRSFLRYRTARKICHTLVRVGSKGNQALSRFCRSLS